MARRLADLRAFANRTLNNVRLSVLVIVRLAIRSMLDARVAGGEANVNVALIGRLIHAAALQMVFLVAGLALLVFFTHARPHQPDPHVDEVRLDRLVQCGSVATV